MNSKHQKFGWNLPLLIIGGLLLLVLFNVLSGFAFGYIVGDITKDGRYALSSSTRSLLKNLNEAVSIRFYVSKDLSKNSRRYGDYADYINRLLEQYVAHSNGKVKLEQIDITPFSSSEVEAQKAFQKPLTLADDVDSHLYLGANFITSKGKSIGIPFFSLNRKSILEDDISRVISILNSARSPLIGVISPYFNIAAYNKVVNYGSEWPFLKQIKAAGFRILPINPSAAEIPDEVDALLIYYPLAMLQANMYAVDQYLVRGGKVMIMLDAFSELRFTQDDDYRVYDSGMNEFLNHLGVKYYAGALLGDFANNYRVMLNNRKVPYPLYLKVIKNNIADHPINKGISELRLNYASVFSYKEAAFPLRQTVLFTSGDQSGLVSVEQPLLQSYDVLQSNFQMVNKPLPLALLLEGKFKPFYSIPVSLDINFLAKLPPFHSVADNEGKLLLVGDGDMAAWSLWHGAEEISDQPFYLSDNVLFIRNALDYLTDSGFSEVGQKNIIIGKNNLNSVIAAGVEKKFSPLREKTSLELENTKHESHQLAVEEKNNQILSSVGRKKRILELQLKERNLELQLKQIDYQMQEEYNHNMNLFAFIMMFFSCLLSIMTVWGLYYLYQRFYISKQRTKFYEQDR